MSLKYEGYNIMSNTNVKCILNVNAASLLYKNHHIRRPFNKLLLTLFVRTTIEGGECPQL